jgi:hypothetical protein
MEKSGELINAGVELFERRGDGCEGTRYSRPATQARWWRPTNNAAAWATISLGVNASVTADPIPSLSKR